MSETNEEENTPALAFDQGNLHPAGSRKKSIIICLALLACLAASILTFAHYYRDSANQAACEVRLSSLHKYIDSYV